VLFADAHAHANFVSGLGAEKVAEKFSRSGGWFMAFVSLPPWHYGVTPHSFEDYARVISSFIADCHRASSHVRAACFVGFHPAEVDRLVSMGMSIDRVLKLGVRIIEYIGELCKRGEVNGIGEVGRQHYKSMPERFAVAQAIMQKALEVSRDHDCLLHLHLEEAGSVTVDTVDMLVKTIGVRRGNVLFHHATLKIAERAHALGYHSTIPGRPKQLEAAITRLPPVFMPESDYLDDPRRGCSVVCPWDMASWLKKTIAQGLASEEYMARINIDNIVDFYRVEPP